MKIEIIESQLVTPNKTTPNHKLWLSNLDFSAGVAHFSFVVVYRRPLNGHSDVSNMKTALSEVLVPFYPLTGRLGVDDDSRTEVHCTGEGALFVVASVDASIDDLGEFLPCPEVGMLVPSLNTPGYDPKMVLAVQVTFFKCGGLTVSMLYNHALVDGASLLAFYKMWCTFSRSGVTELKVPPFFDRSMLRARSPPNADLFCSTLPMITNRIKDEPSFECTVLKLSKHQVNLLKTIAKQPKSTFLAVMAHTWKCACLARNLPPHLKTHIYVIVDIRNRLSSSLPPTFFGNAICRIAASSTVHKVTSNPLSTTANTVKLAIENVTDEYVRSLIDYGGSDLDGFDYGTDLLANNWLSFRAEYGDFGWGRPERMRSAKYFGVGRVYTVSDKDGAVSVPMTMEPENINKFERIFHQELDKLYVDYEMVSKL